MLNSIDSEKQLLKLTIIHNNSQQTGTQWEFC